MNPLHHVVRAGHCRATHQLFAIDALRLVQTDAGQRLSSWLLRYYGRYLRGAIDPDIRFRDFQNHVIHVQDGFWGGAPRVAHQWYDRLQRYLRQQRFSDAAHAAGALSHYFTDPIQPLNTAYAPEEEAIHRPLQWSIQRDYDAIYRLWREDDLRVVFQLADGPGWLGAAMLHGAKYAHQRYDTLVRTYRLDDALGNPVAGIDPQTRVILAELFGLAITGWARVIERAASDAEAVIGQPLPRASSVWPLMSATICLPVAYWRHRIESRIEDCQIEEMVDEFRREGKLQEHLPAEVDIKKQVINVYRNERHYRLNQRRRREQRNLDRAERQTILIAPYLTSSQLRPIELLAIDAEDLKRLRAAGLATLEDLQNASPTDVAGRLRAYWINADTVCLWQCQAALMRQASELPPDAARILVGAGFETLIQVIQTDTDTICEKVAAFATTTEGRRCLKSKPAPSPQEVLLWVGQIKSSTQVKNQRQRRKAA